MKKTAYRAEQLKDSWLGREEKSHSALFFQISMKDK